MPSTFLLRVSALATLFATSTFATPLSLHPRVVAAISEWDYAGCYTEANNMRALTGNSYYDDLMTVEKCAAVCSRFKWFGVEYGRECYCGNVINTGSVVTQASECSFSCPGNAVENCGAGNRLDMYSSTVAPPNSASFSSLGCYTEGTNGRTLVEKDYSSDSMTIELCASTCEGYAYFGVEYYRECYCGNSLVGGSTPAPSTDCNHECMGDNSELCGGDWRLNLYQLGPTITPTISTTASTSSTTSPSTATQSSSSYTFQGCYTEATEQRALSMGAYFDNFMTVPKCAAACSGYTWFGVEYGRECYCGNTINKGSVPTDVSECSFTCPGDETTFCGAGNRLDMYHYGVASTSTSDSSTTSIESSTSFPTTSSTTIDTSSTTISSISSDSSTTSSESATSTTLTPSASSSESSTIASSTESSSSTSSGSLSTSTSASSSSSSSSSSSTSSTSATSSSTSSSSSIPTTSTTTSSSQSSTITTFSTSTSQSSSSSSTSTTTSTAPLCTLMTPIKNGDFEDTPDNTWLTSNTGIGTGSYAATAAGIAAHGGQRKGRVQLSFNTAIVNVYQSITVCPGVKYNLSGWARRVSNTGGLTCQVTYLANGATIVKSTLPTNAGQALAWIETTGSMVFSTATVNFMMKFDCPLSLGLSTTYGLFIDDVVLTLA